MEAYIPTHCDETAMDGAPERLWWRKKQIPPPRYGMEISGCNGNVVRKADESRSSRLAEG